MSKLPLVIGGAALLYYFTNSKKKEVKTEPKEKPIEYPNGFIVENCKVKISNRDKAMIYGYMMGKMKTENQFNNGIEINEEDTVNEIIDANCFNPEKNDPKVLFDSYESAKFVFDLTKNIFSGIVYVVPDLKELLLADLVAAKKFIGELGYNTTDFTIEFPKKS